MSDVSKTPPVQTAGQQPNSILIQNDNNNPSVRQGRQDWLATFPEAQKEYILPKIRELESTIANLEKVATNKLRGSKRISDGWYVREVIKNFEIADLVDLKRELYRLRRYLPQPKTSGRVDQNRINQAKEYPIIEIAESQLQNLKRSGRSYRSLCPFHDERTPSFHLYPENNTFYCFGCQAHGDVIALTQKFLSMSFIEAVKHLTPAYES